MYLSTSISEIKDKKVTLSTGEIIEPDFILFATGRKPYEGLMAVHPTIQNLT